MMAVNLKGPFLCSQAVIDTMKKQQSGRIISLGSLAGQVGGLVASAPYSASKAGVMCLTKSLARALGPHNITVNAYKSTWRRGNGHDDEPSRSDSTDGARSGRRTGGNCKRHPILGIR